MTFIIIATIILFFVMIGWTWNNLADIEKPKKIAYIIISVLVTYLITLIIFNISKSGVEYQNPNMISTVQNMITAVFTAVNGFIIIQYLGRIFGQIDANQIDKDIASKKIIIILVIFVACLIFECSYMKDIQTGMLRMYGLSN